MSAAIRIDFLRMLATSPEVLLLAAGNSTHDPACILVAKLVRFTQDEERILAIVAGCLPKNYNGNTLSEVPAMVKGALAKGFDQVRASGKSAPSIPDLLQHAFEQSGAELFHCPDHKPYATIPAQDSGHVTFPLRSSTVRDFLHSLYYAEHRCSAPDAALEQAIDGLAAQARFSAPQFEIAHRVGGTLRSGDGGDDGDAIGDSYVIHDLGRDDGQVVEIDASGYRLTTTPRVRMVRMLGMGALPLPEPEAQNNIGIDAFCRLFSLDPETAKLCIGFLIGAMNPSGPFACLAVEGQAGSGKSVLCEAIKATLDPAKAMRAAIPATIQDLMLAASNHRVPVFDNLSSISNVMSDALCSLSTGAGFQTRELYTNEGLIIIKLARPFVLNGIGEFVRRGDLVDRAIPIQLTALGPDQRKSEAAIWRAFRKLLPNLLHDIYRAVQTAIVNLPTMPEVTSVRMADMAQWVSAAEPTLGWEPGSFVRLLAQVQNEAKGALADNPVTQRLLAVLKDTSEANPFEGTMTDLLDKLSVGWDRNDRFKPNTPAHLSTMLQRMRDGLRERGVIVEFPKRNRKGRAVRAWLTEGTVPPEPTGADPETF